MFIFGMNLAGKLWCEVFPGRLDYQPAPRKLDPESAKNGLSVRPSYMVTYNSSI